MYFAKLGYDVLGVDISGSAIQQCKRTCSKLTNVNFKQSGITEFDIEENTYSLISASWTLPFISADKLPTIVNNIVRGLSVVD